MKGKLALLGAALAMSAAFAQGAAAQTLPASVQTDRATLQQDKTAVQSAVQQLRDDQAAGNPMAAAADRTALRLAHIKMRQDFHQLAQDAQPVVQADQAALVNALNKLLADQRANNAGAVPGDQAAVTAAEAQIRSDREAIFGGLGGFGHHDRAGHGAG